MVRIPRTEPTVAYQPGQQPFSTGDGYAAPGKAMQQLGAGIAAAGEGFASLFEKDNEFDDKLKTLNFINAEDRARLDAQANFQGDPQGFAKSWDEGAAERARQHYSTLTSKWGRTAAPLQVEQHRGNAYENNFRFESGRILDQRIQTTRDTITGEFSRPEMDQPDTVVPSITTGLAAARAIINQVPGVTPAQREHMMREAGDMAMAKLQATYRANGRDDMVYTDAVKMIEDWRKSNPQAYDGLVRGPQQQSGFTAPTAGAVAAVIDQPAREYDARGYGKTTTGKITVNGRTYEFVNGGTGRGSIPLGEYEIKRFTTGAQREREGYQYTRDAFELSDKVDDAPGTQGQDARRGLLIHDGNRGVTAGCIGIKGDFRQFQQDLQTEIARNGGKLKLWLGTPQQAQPTQQPPSGPTGYTSHSPSDVRNAFQPKVTAYSPQAPQSKLGGMEGGYAASKAGPDGKAEVRTLEDVASGRSNYITIAGDPDQYGKTYTIPKIEWIDSQGKRQVSTNVTAVVHDTGAAFKGAGDKRFDIPVGRDLTNDQMNAQPFLKGGVQFVPGSGTAAATPKPPMVKVAMAGMSDKDKAAKLDELVRSGYQDITHQLGSEVLPDGTSTPAHDVLIARQSDTPRWYKNMRSGPDKPSELDRPDFAGPQWATEKIAQMRTGQLAPPREGVIPSADGAPSEGGGIPGKGKSVGAVQRFERAGNSIPSVDQVGAARRVLGQALPGVGLDSFIKGNEIDVGKMTPDDAGKVADALKRNGITAIERGGKLVISDEGPQQARQTIPGVAGPAQQPPSQDAGRIGAPFVETLIRHLPQLAQQHNAAQERWAQNALAKIKEIKDLAEKGVAPDESVIGGLKTAIKQRPDLASRFQIPEAMDSVQRVLQWNQQARQMPPQALQGYITQIDAQIRQNGGNKDAVAQKEHAEKLLANMRTQINKDPLTWAQTVGLRPLGKIDLDDPASLQRRADDARAIGQYYGQPPQFFTQAERDQLSDVMRKGGDPMLQMLSRVYSMAGPDAGFAMREFAKDAPEAAYIGGHVADNDGRITPIARDAGEAFKLRAEGKIKVPALKDKTLETADFTKELGTAYKESRATRDAIIRTAEAIYDVRAVRLGKGDTFDEKLFGSIVRELTGMTKDQNGVEYGGLSDHGGYIFGIGSHKVVAPSSLRNDSFDAMLRQITDDDLKAANQVPLNKKGEPISVKNVTGHTLVSAGKDRYYVQMGDPTDAQTPYLTKPDGSRYVLDLGRLVPLIQSRRPDLFMGGSEALKQWPKP